MPPLCILYTAAAVVAREKRIAKCAKKDENAKAFLTQRLKDSMAQSVWLLRVDAEKQERFPHSF
jgi:hypothetical protein